MRRIAIFLIFALVGLAACDVEIEIRRGKNAAPDAGALIEAPDPAAGTTGTETKPAPKDKGLKDELGDVWNRVERDGKELARDAEEKAREVAQGAEKKADEIKKDVGETIDKKDISPGGLLSRIPWWGWVLIVLAGLVLIGGLLDALDIFEGFFEALGKLLAMLFELTVKAAVALAKGFVSLASAIGKAFRRKRRPKAETCPRRDDPNRAMLDFGSPLEPDPPKARESDADRELQEAERRYNEARLRKQREDLEQGRIEPYRGTMRPHPDSAPQAPRAPAPPRASDPPRRAKRDDEDDDDGPGIAETVVGAVAGAAEVVGEVVGSIADGVGDIDLD